VRIEVSLGTSAGTVELPVPSITKKTVRVHAVILRNKSQWDGGSPVTTSEAVREDILHRVNERFAQAGVVINLDASSVQGDIEIEDPPAGVDLSNGLLADIDTGNYDECFALSGAFRSRFPTDIWIFYINSFTAHPELRGLQIGNSIFRAWGTIPLS
jgi:hypothetical protein